MRRNFFCLNCSQNFLSQEEARGLRTQLRNSYFDCLCQLLEGSFFKEFGILKFFVFVCRYICSLVFCTYSALTYFSYRLILLFRLDFLKVFFLVYIVLRCCSIIIIFVINCFFLVMHFKDKLLPLLLIALLHLPLPSLFSISKDFIFFSTFVA